MVGAGAAVISQAGIIKGKACSELCPYLVEKYYLCYFFLSGIPAAVLENVKGGNLW